MMTADFFWAPRAAPTRGPKRTLTQEVIAEAAIDIGAIEGLAAVSMQRVAAALGVTKMALYRYLPGKQELVALMVERAVGAPPVLVTGAWRSDVELWARALLGRFVAYPWLIEATVGARPLGPNEIGWTESGLAALRGLPLRGSERLDAIAVLAGHARALAQQATAATPIPKKDDKSGKGERERQALAEEGQRGEGGAEERERSGAEERERGQGGARERERGGAGERERGGAEEAEWSEGGAGERERETLAGEGKRSGDGAEEGEWGGGGAEEGMARVLRAVLRHHRERFPHLAAAVEDPAGERDQAFEFGLARILDGLQVLVDSRGGLRAARATAVPPRSVP